MIYEREVRHRISSYLRRQISLSALERWIASASLSMFNDGSQKDVIELIAAVNMAVSELHDAIIGDEEFRSELSALLNHIVVAVPIDVSEKLAMSLRPHFVSSARWHLLKLPPVAA